MTLTRHTPDVGQQTVEAVAIKLYQRYGLDFARRLAAVLDRLARMSDERRRTQDEEEETDADDSDY